MRSLLPLVSISVALFLGCGDDGRRRGDSSIDVDSGMDSGVPDTSAPETGPPDTGMDSGMDGAGDTGLADAGDVGVCNPVSGIECDGDWEGRCATLCGTDQCCSPVDGRFTCVPRVGGRCPAADIWVDEGRLLDDVEFEWVFFEDGDCAIAEGCVMGPGWRRLLRFPTWTPNTGGADLYLGRPSDSLEYFEYSACHDHYHFNSYAQYELRNLDGSVAAEGHKQAFCLLDFYQYPGTDGRGANYTCSNQGISRDWQDVYGGHLDCQWVDVTDVEEGDYDLWVDLNFEHILNESDYSNNSSTLRVTVPEAPPLPADVDVTLPCPSGTGDGATRNCGLTRLGEYTCTVGATINVGCSATCGLGSCTGDPFLRVCDITNDPTCMNFYAIASNDDSGCGSAACGAAGGDCCSQTSFTCPASGEYVVFTGPYRVGGTSSCTVASTVTP
jgi:hypothetical protein